MESTGVYRIPIYEILVCCFRNNLLTMGCFKHLTRPLDFAQNLLAL